MEFGIFRAHTNIRCGLSERKDGFMNVAAFGAERDEIAAENRRRFFSARGLGERFFVPNAMHGSDVRLVTIENSGEQLAGDGFVTQAPGIVLTVTVADCFPLYFCDPVKRAVGLAHAGWRGVVSGLVQNMVRGFAEHFGSSAGDLLLGIGPGIQVCHFTVRDDVIGQFRGRGCDNFIYDAGGGEHRIDLLGIIQQQAKSAGMAHEHIEAIPDCTFCMSDRYFSHRRDSSRGSSAALRDRQTPPLVIVAYAVIIKE